MKVLVAHNFYQQPGGEDQVFRSELALLESRGHEPLAFEMHNDAVAGMGRLALFGATIWNRPAAARLREIVRANAIELVHFHNTFPLMSPSVYAAARTDGAAVVQTLHNFRVLCPGANFFGRLSREKGLDTLLAAWETCRAVLPLKIVGDGPLAEQVKDAAARNRSIEWLGRRPMNDVLDLIGRAEVLIFPSECYETFGRT